VDPISQGERQGRDGKYKSVGDKMYKGFSIAVVMPIHNEENHIERAVSRVPSFVDRIVAIDDGSLDDTWSRLGEIAEPRLIKLRHGQNLGVGAATKTGYEYCLRAPVDFIAVMDGDGQMDGGDLYGLLDCAIAGADYVKGNRFLSQTISYMPLARLAGNRVFSFLTRCAASFADDLDAQCGYTVIRRSALQRLNLKALYNRYGFPNEMFFAACREGLKVESVAVRAVYEDEVSGINPFTAIPVISYLILKSYLRRRWSMRTAAPELVLRESEIRSAN
jgi:glycosyltransferase involved in cell wall biosynthesis